MKLERFLSSKARPSRPKRNSVELFRHRAAATIGVILLGAFWWFASGPSNGTVTFLAAAGFAAIATLALLDAALGGPDPRKS